MEKAPATKPKQDKQDGGAHAAAQKLNRRWIGIDVTFLAIGLIKQRLQDAFGDSIKTTYDVIGERVDLGFTRSERRHLFPHRSLLRLDQDVIQPEHILLLGLGIGPDNDGGKLVRTLSKVKCAKRDFRSVNHAVMEEVDWLARLRTVDGQLHDAIVDRLEKTAEDFVAARLGDLKLQQQLVAGLLPAVPPKMLPAAIVVPVLRPRRAGRFHDPHLFTLDRAGHLKNGQFRNRSQDKAFGRDRREGVVRAGQAVVISRHGHIHFAVFPMPELHVELEALREGDAVEDVEAIDARAAVVSRPVATRLTVIGVGEELRAAPAVAVVIFRAGAEMAGEGLAVDIDLLVALAPPLLDGIIDEEGRADEDTLALGRQVVPVLHRPRAERRARSSSGHGNTSSDRSTAKVRWPRMS